MGLDTNDAKTRHRKRPSERPEPLTGTEVSEEEDAELAGPAATASFDDPPEPLRAT